MIPEVVSRPYVPPRGAVLLRKEEARDFLGVSSRAIGNLLGARVLSKPIDVAEVARLAGYGHLALASGELTVFRAGPRSLVDPRTAPFYESRKALGFDVEISDDEIVEASLRWWRVDPDRLLANEYLAVIVASFPVAVLALTGVDASVAIPEKDEMRHAFTGRLLGRLTREGLTIEGSLDSGTRDLVTTILTNRVSADGNGPIGFLTAEV